MRQSLSRRPFRVCTPMDQPQECCMRPECSAGWLEVPQSQLLVRLHSSPITDAGRFVSATDATSTDTNCAPGGPSHSSSSRGWAASASRALLFHANSCEVATPRSRQNSATLFPLSRCSETRPRHLAQTSVLCCLIPQQCGLANPETRWSSDSAHDLLGLAARLKPCPFKAGS